MGSWQLGQNTGKFHAIEESTTPLRTMFKQEASTVCWRKEGVTQIEHDIVATFVLLLEGTLF
jgi:hypothetical protein